MTQHIYIFDSPDGTGKTEIAKELSRRICVPYFKMNSEHQNWRDRTFKEALRFDQTYLSQFLKQTRYSAIIDRAFPAEWVYSKVFNRETDDRVLLAVDKEFADMNATIIIPLRRSYKNSRPDEVVPEDRLQEIHDMYLKFCEWTRCSTIQVFVDDFDNNLNEEINSIYRGLDLIESCRTLHNSQGDFVMEKQ